MFLTGEAYFELHGDTHIQNIRIWATSNPREYMTKSQHTAKL